MKNFLMSLGTILLSFAMILGLFYLPIDHLSGLTVVILGFIFAIAAISMILAVIYVGGDHDE